MIELFLVSNTGPQSQQLDKKVVSLIPGVSFSLIPLIMIGLLFGSVLAGSVVVERSSAQLVPSIRLIGGNFSGTGSTLSGVGDLDSDGFPDLAIGHPVYPDASPPLNGLHIVPGSMLQNVTTLNLGFTSNLTDEIWHQPFGTSVTHVGDIDGDGHDDLLVGALSAGGHDGAIITPVYSVAGRPGLFDTSLNNNSIRLDIGPAPSAVGGLGDVNGDGLNDFMMGEDQVPLLVLGHDIFADGTLDQNWTTEFNIGEMRLPFLKNFEKLGDLNGDGLDDVAIWDLNGSGILVFFGRENWPGSLDAHDANITVQEPFSCDLCSFTGGDLDGDGHDDLVMANDNGELWVLWGGPYLEGNMTAELLVMENSGTTRVSLDASADLDGDGSNDILLSLGGSSTEIVLRIYAGQPGVRAVTDTGLRYSTQAEYSRDWISYIGDIDRDGQVDFALGTPGNPNGSAIIFTDVSWNIESGDDQDEKDDQGREPDWGPICIPAWAILAICIMALLFEFRWIPGRRSQTGPQLPMDETDSSIAGPPDLQR